MSLSLKYIVLALALIAPAFANPTADPFPDHFSDLAERSVKLKYNVTEGSFSLKKAPWRDCHRKIKAVIGSAKDKQKYHKETDGSKSRKNACFKLTVGPKNTVVHVKRIKYSLKGYLYARRVKKINAKGHYNATLLANKSKTKAIQKKEAKKAYKKAMKQKTWRYKVVGGWPVSDSKKLGALAIRMKNITLAVEGLKNQHVLLATDKKQWVIIRSSKWRRGTIKRKAKAVKDAATKTQ